MTTLYRRGQLKAAFDHCRNDAQQAAIDLERAAYTLWGMPTCMNPQADAVRAIVRASSNLRALWEWCDVRPLSAPPTPPPSISDQAEKGKFLWD